MSEKVICPECEDAVPVHCGRVAPHNTINANGEKRGCFGSRKKAQPCSCVMATSNPCDRCGGFPHWGDSDD